VRALACWSPAPPLVWAPDYPWGERPEDVDRDRASLAQWGSVESSASWADALEGLSGDRPSEEAIRWWARKERNTCTPEVAETLLSTWWQTDIRGVLPAVQAPTLLMVTEGEAETLAVAEHVASLMPGAQIEAFAQRGWMTSDTEVATVNGPRLDAIARCVGVQRRPAVPDTILPTILFTDIVDSTSHQARLGDRDWKHLIEGHNRLIREALSTRRGREKTPR
jgi:hypothetical protein